MRVRVALNAKLARCAGRGRGHRPKNEAQKRIRHQTTYLGSIEGRKVESWPEKTARGILLSVFVIAPPPTSSSSSAASPAGSTSNDPLDLPPMLQSVNTVHFSLVGVPPAPRVLAAKMGSGATREEWGNGSGRL